MPYIILFGDSCKWTNDSFLSQVAYDNDATAKFRFCAPKVGLIWETPVWRARHAVPEGFLRLALSLDKNPMPILDQHNSYF